jgi:hypothetical protein
VRYLVACLVSMALVLFTAEADAFGFKKKKHAEAAMPAAKTYSLKKGASQQTNVTVNVRQDAGRGGGGRGDWRGRGDRRGGWGRGPRWGEVAGGLILGNVISNVLFPRREEVVVQREVVVAPAPTPELQPFTAPWYEYCAQRYRSFDAQTGTYLGFDKQRHFCK